MEPGLVISLILLALGVVGLLLKIFEKSVIINGKKVTLPNFSKFSDKYSVKVLTIASDVGIGEDIKDYFDTATWYYNNRQGDIYSSLFLDIYNKRKVSPSKLNEVKKLQNEISESNKNRFEKNHLLAACEVIKINIYWVTEDYDNFINTINSFKTDDSLDLSYCLAYAYYNLNAYSKAIDKLQEFDYEDISNNPIRKNFFAKTQLLLAECFLAENEPLLAQNVTKNILRKSSCGEKNVRLRMRKLLGDIYYQIGDRNKCIKSYRKVLEKDYKWEDEDGQPLRDKLQVIEEESENSGSRYIPSHVRKKVWKRDNGRCVECNSTNKLHFDHIVPVAKGGANTVENIQILCASCNLKKGDKIQ